MAAGVTVGEVYRTLFERWGTVIPLGEYPGIGMGGHVVGGAAADAAEQQIEACVTACREGMSAPGGRELSRMSSLEFALNPFPDLFGMPTDGVRIKAKDAMLKRRFSDCQAGVAYDHLTSTGDDLMGGMLGLASYGGRMNAVAPNAAAARSAARSSTPPARRDGRTRATT